MHKIRVNIPRSCTYYCYQPGSARKFFQWVTCGKNKVFVGQTTTRGLRRPRDSKWRLTSRWLKAPKMSDRDGPRIWWSKIKSVKPKMWRDKHTNTGGNNSFTYSESRHVETNFYVLRNVHYDLTRLIRVNSRVLIIIINARTIRAAALCNEFILFVLFSFLHPPPPGE